MLWLAQNVSRKKECPLWANDKALTNKKIEPRRVCLKWFDIINF